MRPRPALTALFALTGACLLPCLCFSEFFRAVFWFTYGPFWLSAVLLVCVLVQEGVRSSLFCPACATMLLAPFATWHAAGLSASLHVFLSVLALNVSAFWLIQTVNLRLAEQGAGSPSLERLASLNMRLFIYLGIIPTCVCYILSGVGFLEMWDETLFLKNALSAGWMDGFSAIPRFWTVRASCLCASAAITALLSLVCLCKHARTSCQPLS